MPQELKNGAFNCIQAVVSKGMDHASKIGFIRDLHFLEILDFFGPMQKPELDIETCDDEAEKLYEELY